MTSRNLPSARALWPALIVLLIALLGCNRGLWTPDEPREAEISREMLLSPGVIPTLDGQPFIEKPPLYYWTVAGLFRLTGGPSVAAARAVSVLAGLATLWLLYVWACRAASRRAGTIAALMLASSVQFLASTHWVLIDPLLMLATSVAAWAAWRLLFERDGAGLRAALYLALIAALWIKGLIGPVLIGAGLMLYGAVERPVHWRRLHAFTGMAVLAVATGMLAFAIFAQGGRAALWEWGYVNHVQRLTHPGITGHRQPPLYYAWTLPYAILPWLPLLIEALRPAYWRRRDAGAAVAAAGAAADEAGTRSPAGEHAARYGAWMSAGMLLLLSLSATKRETYLLPLLPLLFLWLGVRADQWWQARSAAGRSAPWGALWWTELTLLTVYCLAAPVGAAVWSRSLAWPVWPTLAIAGAAAAAPWWASRARPQSAGVAAVGAACIAAATTLALVPPLLGPMKDMGSFMRSIGRQLPPEQSVYATGVDETLRAEVPFYTGRALIAWHAGEPQPGWLLVQDNDGRASTPPPAYRLMQRQAFGPRRLLSLWHREGG